jgi:hypothetical protein
VSTLILTFTAAGRTRDPGASISRRSRTDTRRTSDPGGVWSNRRCRERHHKVLGRQRTGGHEPESVEAAEHAPEARHVILNIGSVSVKSPPNSRAYRCNLRGEDQEGRGDDPDPRLVPSPVASPEGDRRKAPVDSRSTKEPGAVSCPGHWSGSPALNGALSLARGFRCLGLESVLWIGPRTYPDAGGHI